MKYCVFYNRKGKGQLPQGAPTSPYLTNIGMYPFDRILSNYANKLGFNYTRYADDMSFSAVDEHAENNKIRLIEAVKKILHMGLGLTLSHKKTKVAYINSPRVRRSVTGVTLTADGKGYAAKKCTREEARNAVHKLWKAVTAGNTPLEDLLGEYSRMEGLVNYCDYLRIVDGKRKRDRRIDRDKLNTIRRRFQENGLRCTKFFRS